MKSHAQIPYLKEFIIFLAATALAVPMLQRRMSSVLGYLLIGGLIGPHARFAR